VSSQEKDKVFFQFSFKFLSSSPIVKFTAPEKFTVDFKNFGFLRRRRMPYVIVSGNLNPNKNGVAGQPSIPPGWRVGISGLKGIFLIQLTK
jgi:hypothetical protein